jgi:Uma2 family endonuclease
MATQSIPRVNEEEYLRLERAAEYKSEFLDGEIFAISGGSLRHSYLASNWTALLNSRLKGKGCYVFTSDARVRTPKTGSYLYPDVSVACGGPQTHQNSNDILVNPQVLIEVLSPFTAGYDHGKKFECYREIPSLREYVLVHADLAHVEHYVRQPDASWIFREYRGLEAAVPIASIDCNVPLADVYSGVLDLPA